MVAHLQAPETQLPNESSNQPLRFPVLPPISFFCSLLLIEAFKTQQSCSIRSCSSFPFQLHPHNSLYLSSSSTWLTLCLALQVYGNGLSIPNPAAEVVYMPTLISEQLTKERGKQTGKTCRANLCVGCSPSLFTEAGGTVLQGTLPRPGTLRGPDGHFWGFPSPARCGAAARGCPVPMGTYPGR